MTQAATLVIGASGLQYTISPAQTPISSASEGSAPNRIDLSVTVANPTMGSIDCASFVMFVPVGGDGTGLSAVMFSATPSASTTAWVLRADPNGPPDGVQFEAFPVGGGALAPQAQVTFKLSDVPVGSVTGTAKIQVTMTTDRDTDQVALLVQKVEHPIPPQIVAAYEEGRLSVRPLSELASPGGTDIVPVDDGVLVLVDDEPTAMTRLSEPRASVTLFEGAEHALLGDAMTLHFESGDTKAGAYRLPLPNSLRLTYGQVLALGGDFYGLPDAPISTAKAPDVTFRHAFETLAVAEAATTECPAILQIMQKEVDAVNKAVAHGQPPSSAYDGLGDTLSAEWNKATGGGSFISDWIPSGRYLDLAAVNWDHFGEHALTVYKAGHDVAIRTALAARGAATAAARLAQLELAYAMNAFADHYLTDIFSAGHMRTPRKPLYDTVTPSEIGSLLSRFMHDEDSRWGLSVRNGAGTSWVAYGDKRFSDTVNADNAAIVRSAVQASIDEVYAAYRSGAAPSSYAAMQLVPDLSAVNIPQDRANGSPMFVWDGGAVRRRTDPTRRDDYSWTTHWWGWSTLTWLEEHDLLGAAVQPMPAIAGDDSNSAPDGTSPGFRLTLMNSAGQPLPAGLTLALQRDGAAEIYAITDADGQALFSAAVDPKAGLKVRLALDPDELTGSGPSA